MTTTSVTETAPTAPTDESCPCGQDRWSHATCRGCDRWWTSPPECHERLGTSPSSGSGYEKPFRSCWVRALQFGADTLCGGRIGCVR